MFFWNKSPRRNKHEDGGGKLISMMDTLPADPLHSRRSYSQSGEDMLVAYLAHTLRLENFTYLDIGAYSSSHLSNTNFFYERSYYGVCVEANPILAKDFSEVRPNDKVLNIAVSPDFNGVAPFYVLSAPTLSTLSEIEAKRLVADEGVFLVEVIDINVRSIDTLIKTEFPNRNLNFISLDVEGIDIDIMRNFDFSYVKPEILCLETLEYKKVGYQRKNLELIELVVAKGYEVYADTQINTIFIDKNKWEYR